MDDDSPHRSDYVRIGQPAEEFERRVRTSPDATGPAPLPPAPLDSFGSRANPWEFALWIIGVVSLILWLVFLIASTNDGVPPVARPILRTVSSVAQGVFPVALGGAAVLAGFDWLRRQPRR